MSNMNVIQHATLAERQATMLFDEISRDIRAALVAWARNPSEELKERLDMLLKAQTETWHNLQVFRACREEDLR